MPKPIQIQPYMSEAFARQLALANAGDGRAQILVAFMYRRGEGVVQSHYEAVRWMRAAALQGVPAACFYYALALEAGWGTARCATSSRTWLLRAAERRFAPAQWRIGQDLLAQGDREAARQWIDRAAQGGLRDACRWLENHPRPATTS